MVYASSSAVYGDDGTQDAPAARVESMLPQLVSPYGAGKMAGETYCRVFHEVYGLETVALHASAKLDPKVSLALMMADAETGEIMNVYDGLTWGTGIGVLGDTGSSPRP